MDITKVEVLLSAIELGSLSKAAERYSYTPSAVTHIVDAIESEIGVKIIKRTHMGIEIQRGREDIIDSLKLLVSAKNDIMKMAAAKTKTHKITIATYASLSKYVLPKIVIDFKRQFPDADINIIVDDNLQSVYEKGLADILFGEKIENDNIIWEELMIDPYVAVFPKTQAFSDKAISREKLYTKTFIMAKDRKISDYMSEEKIDDIIKIDSHDDSSVIQMIKEGMGVSILSSLAVDSNQGVAMAQLNPRLSRVLGLMYGKKHLADKEYARKFVDYIRRYDMHGKFCFDIS